MTYKADFGLIIRAKIVEACRTPQTCRSLAPLVFLSGSNVAKYCRELDADGWLKITRGNNKSIPMVFNTIREDKFPSPDEYEEYEAKQKPNTSPYARTIRLSDRKESWWQRPLRKSEFRGIQSSAQML